MTLEHAPGANRIVVGIDGSESSLDALSRAARQADLTGDSLEVVMAWEWPPSSGWAIPVPDGFDPGEDIRHSLDSAVTAVRSEHRDLRIDGRVVSGHPAPTLVESSKGADLLVVGSRGHGGFVGMLIGSVSEYCITHAHCPTLVHRVPSSATPGPSPRIVVGVDGSPSADRALEWAVVEARRSGAELQLVTAWTFPLALGYSFTATVDEVRGVAQEELERALVDVRDAAPDVTVTGETTEQEPAPALVAAARGAELLVVGSRGRGGFEGLLLGSVGQYSTRHADCSVVVVH